MKLLIKNGLLMDGKNNFYKTSDILIENEKISKIADSINLNNSEVEQVIDAKNCIVIPGLIDHHTHLYPFIVKGIPAESICFSSGVTTVVDAGSTGCETYEKVRDFLKYTRLRIKSYLNISSYGLSTLPELENLDPMLYNKEKLKELFYKYPKELIGLKLRLSKGIVKDLKITPLIETLKIANELSVPVMVHITDPPESLDTIIDFFRKDDVLTHMYQDSSFTILDKDKSGVSKKIKEARERGVIFEAADARAHFSFKVSEQAIKDNFFPDIIATDLTAFSMYQRPTAFNLLMQISKYENIGISFNKIIESCTVVPAKILGIDEEVGKLEVGYLADIAILKKEYQEVEFGDRPYNSNEKREIRKGKFIYNNMMTIKNGEIVYRNVLF